MFALEFVVREAGKTETVVAEIEYRTKKAAEKAAAGYVFWGKRTQGKPVEVKVVRVVH